MQQTHKKDIHTISTNELIFHSPKRENRKEKVYHMQVLITFFTLLLCIHMSLTTLLSPKGRYMLLMQLHDSFKTGLLFHTTSSHSFIQHSLIKSKSDLPVKQLWRKKNRIYVIIYPMTLQILFPFSFNLWWMPGCALCHENKGINPTVRRSKDWTQKEMHNWKWTKTFCC